MRDTTFYDRESSRYSEKRYPKIAESYLHYFYLRRLEIVQMYVQRSHLSEARLLEIGCADGVVTRAIAASFPKAFSSLVGVDIAEEMVHEAARRTNDPRVSFRVRRDLPPDEPFEIVVEVGVVNYASVDEELRAAHAHMAEGARYILSIAGTDSLKNRLKGEDGFNDFRTYRIYEQLIAKDFIVEAVRGVGVFVPYLWRFPRLARLIQPIVDALCNALSLRRLCHEQVYLLKKRAN